MSGVVVGVVREWRAEEGWGVVDSPQTPGGCWAHFSSIDMPGYRALTAGDQVQLAWEPASQDGYLFRAVRITPMPRDWTVASVDLPGHPGSLAAAGPAGPVYVVTGSTDGQRLCAFDVDGRLLWARPVDGHHGPRVAGDGGIWVAGGTALEQTRPSGEPGRRFTPDGGHPERRIGAFVLLPDGPLVAWDSDAADTAPVRLERLDTDGRRRWATDLTVTTHHAMPGRTGVDGMLLLAGGQLAFTTQDDRPAVTGSSVLSLARTDLPGPATGPWTGAEGNLRANPVTS